MVLGKTLESPLDCKEVQPVHPKGNQSWIFFGRIDAESEGPILWPPDAKNWLTRKGPDAGKDWRREAKGTTEHEMVEWHHRLNGYEFEWALGVGDGRGGLAHASVHGVAKSRTRLSDWTELNWNLLSPTHLLIIPAGTSPQPWSPTWLLLTISAPGWWWAQFWVHGNCFLVSNKLDKVR